MDSKASGLIKDATRAAKEAIFGIGKEEKTARIERTKSLLVRAKAARNVLTSKTQTDPAMASALRVLVDENAKIIRVIETDTSARNQMSGRLGYEPSFTAIPAAMLTEMEEAMADIERVA